MGTIFRLLFVFIFAEYVSSEEGLCDGDYNNIHDITYELAVLGASGPCVPTTVSLINNAFAAMIPRGASLLSKFQFGFLYSAALGHFFGGSKPSVAEAFAAYFAEIERCIDAHIATHRQEELEGEWYGRLTTLNEALSYLTDAGTIEHGQDEINALFSRMNEAILSDFMPLDKSRYLEAEALLPVFRAAAQGYWHTATTQLYILNAKGMGKLYNSTLTTIQERFEVLKAWYDKAMDIISTMYSPTADAEFWEGGGTLFEDKKFFKWHIKWEEGARKVYGDRCKRHSGGEDNQFAVRITNGFNVFMDNLHKEYDIIDYLSRNAFLIGEYGQISYHQVTRFGEFLSCDNLESLPGAQGVSIQFIISECNAKPECIGFSWSDEFKSAYPKKNVNCENGIASDSRYTSIWKSTSPLCYQQVLKGGYPGCPNDALNLAQVCGDNEFDLRVQCDKDNDCIGYIWDLSASYGCLRSVGCISYGMRTSTVYDYHAKCRDSSDYALNPLHNHEIIVAELRSNGQCLERNTINADRNVVFFADCNDAATQTWKYDIETKEIISMFDNHCLGGTKKEEFTYDDFSTYMTCGGWKGQQWLFHSKALKLVAYNECMKSTGDGFEIVDCSDNDVLRWELTPVIDKTERFTETVTTECYDETGSSSGSADDALSSVTCNAGYQLVSCGTSASKTGNVDGSFISGDTCNARMGAGGISGEYVKAVARCCRLHGTPSCSSYSSSKGATVDVFCANNEMLTGCTVSTAWKNIDGAFPRDDVIASDTDISDSFRHFSLPLLQRCTAQDGGVSGVWAEARCCGYNDNRHNLKCGTIKSTLQSGLDRTASVSCPAGWFLSGCSAYSSSTSATAWYIEDDECIAKAKESSHVEDGVYAVAICCQESYDPSSTHCYSASGDPSGSKDGLSLATCGLGYQLVSCGTSGSTTGNIDGSFMGSTTCYARVGSGASAGEYVRAVARCCSFSSTCTSYKSIESGSNDDATADVFCKTYSLTGCTVQGAALNYVDGAYPRDTLNTNLLGLSGTFYQFTNIAMYRYTQGCRAQNAGGSSRGVFAYARCCTPNDNRYKMKCGTIKSEMSGADYRASVSCPSGWALTGCSGLSHWRAASMWYTEDEECIAIARDGSSPNYGVWAVAICCKESFTKSAAKQIENEKRWIDDDIRDYGYRDDNVTVIGSSLIGVFGVFFIFAVVYCCVQLLKNTRRKSRYTVIDEHDTEYEA